MKKCFRCSRLLSIEEFYQHTQMADGHLNKCKDCTKADSAQREARLMADPILSELERDRHRLKSRRYREAGRVKEQTPEQQRAQLRKQRAKFPEKNRARQLVAHAIRAGLIKRNPCKICGETAHAHHDDYSKPLEVIWFCAKHHSEHHVKLRRIKRQKALLK